MTATTVSDIVTLALKDIGVLGEAETCSAYLMADGLTTLNQMLAEWHTSGVNVYAQQDITFSPTGATSYTIGTGGVINSTAPENIDHAFLRVGDIDYAVEILPTFDDYNAIPQKAIGGSYPEFLYYNRTYPLGVIYLYPQPSTGVMHLITTVNFPAYTASADTLTLPTVYEMAIRLSLGEILSYTMGAALSPRYIAHAARSRRFLKRSNFSLGELNTKVPRGNIFSGG